MVKKIFAMLIIMTLMMASSMTAFAATVNMTRKASSKMTIDLDPKEVNNSNSVSIRLIGLPEDAVITKMPVNTGAMTYNGAAGCNLFNGIKFKW